MHCTITTTTTGGEPIEVARIVADEMRAGSATWTASRDSSCSCSEDRALGLAFWASREIAERHAATRAEFRERMLSIAGAEIRGVDEYEVAFARLGPGLIAAAGG